MAKPTPEQLAKINRFAREPLTEDQVYVHKFRMIGTRLMRRRALQIHETLLPVYKRFIDNGDVVHIADHSFGGWSSKLTTPFGRYFDCDIVIDDKGDKQLDGLMYMKAGQKTYLNGFTTDDIDDQLNSGILHDSSVSIGWGFSQCSICGNDIRDYENCSHWPGRTYKVNDVDMFCHIIAKPLAQNDPSVMIENSSVCAGAYPDAGHMPLSEMADGQQTPEEKGYQKINNMADLKLVKKDAPVFCLLSANDATLMIKPEDKLEPQQQHELLHRLYEAGDLPEGWTMTKLVAAHAETVKCITESEQPHELRDALDGTLPAGLKKLSREPEKGSDDVELQQIVRETLGMAPNDEITAESTKQALKAVVEKANKEKADEILGLLGIEQSENVTLADVLSVVAKEAEQGRQFREDVIETALASGVRDQGNEFASDTYKKMFESLSVDEIKAMGAAWEKSALAKLGTVKNTANGNLDLPGNGQTENFDDEVYSMRK